MGLSDRARNATHRVSGGAKQQFGKATRRKDVQAAGWLESTKADLRQTGEKARTAVRKRTL